MQLALGLQSNETLKLWEWQTVFVKCHFHGLFPHADPRCCKASVHFYETSGFRQGNSEKSTCYELHSVTRFFQAL